MASDRLIHYSDPTGNQAAANVDRHRRWERHSLDEATGQYVMERILDRKTSTAELSYLFRTIGPALAA